MDQDVATQISSLKDMINTVQQSVNTDITIFWTALGFVVVVIGAALVVLARSLVQSVAQKMIEQRLSLLEESVRRTVAEQLSQKIKTQRVNMPAGSFFVIPVTSVPGDRNSVFVQTLNGDGRYSVSGENGDIVIRNLENKALEVEALILHH